MSTNWILLPVPSSDYDNLRAEIVTAQAERGEPTAPMAKEVAKTSLIRSMAERTTLEGHISWPIDALSRLAENSTKTAQRWSTVLDLCAKNPGKFYSTQEIAEMTTLSVNEWRDACRKISAHIIANYPDAPTWTNGPVEGKPVWPASAVSGRELQTKDQLYVGLTDEQARLWLKASGSTAS